MKRTVLILIGIALITLLLFVRLLFNEYNVTVDERKWFVESLRYEFSAQVDSVTMFNENSARLRCLLTVGNPLIEREDSLKRFFKKHDMLYLIFKRSFDSITFVLPNHANYVAKGDSVCVSSRENSIQFFRAGELIVAESLSETLIGYGRPFFIRQ
ncbi:MAG: hypothetical protein ORN54_09780 [Cyclobacteriaceae bacterium]|nr:hypothetical protein [Cyclobacteriaceae bacterium]